MAQTGPMSTTAYSGTEHLANFDCDGCFLDDDKRSNPPSPRAKRGRHDTEKRRRIFLC